MNNEKIGKFISELRRSLEMTQKDLAEKVNVTDKAVSKWERGLSYPDISILSPLSNILGVTPSELLNGERSTNPAILEPNVNIENVLQYADMAVKTKSKNIQKVCALVFSSLMMVGIVVCSIVDLAISGRFTWSLIPIGSIVFAWLVFLPTIKYGKNGIFISLVAVSIFILPFLYVLDNLVPYPSSILPVGIRGAAIAIVFLWIIFTTFKLLKARILIASAISLLLVIPFSVLTNFVLSGLVDNISLVDAWDVLSFVIISIVAAGLLIVDKWLR